MDREAKVGILRQTKFFNHLSDAVLGSLVELCREKSFAEGSFVYRAGDPAADLFVLVDGAIHHPQFLGKDAARVSGRGNAFGFAAVVEGSQRILAARCLEATRLLAIQGKDLHRLLGADSRGAAVLQQLRKVFEEQQAGLVLQGQISIRNAGKIYDPEGIHVVAVDGCTFDIQAGEFCVVVGPSGCGKTTLLNTVAGFDNLTSGEIYLDGKLVAAPDRPLKPGPDRIVVFQLGGLFPWKTVLDNVTYGPVVQGKMKKAAAEQTAVELMEKVGLKGIEYQYPAAISSGMRRRVEIVRALINAPKVLLLDEPFRALDALTKSVMHEYLLELYDMENKTIFFITHDLEEAIFLADKVVVMTTRPGRIKKTISVDLPRPRSYRLLASDVFLDLKQQAIDAVHEEAIKAFEAGERELAR